MAYNRYRGGGGPPQRVETEPPGPERPPVADPPPGPERPPVPEPPSSGPKVVPPPPPGPPGALDTALRRLTPEDLMVMAVLYLAYRSGGDWEMLAALGAYFLL